MFPAVRHITMLDQAVEVFAQGGNGGIEPFEFVRHVVRDNIGNDHARLVQHDVAERDAVRQRTAGEMHGVARGGFGAGTGEGRELAGCNHFGEHHRRRLQGFFLFFGVGPPRAVLHHQHAKRIARAQDRNAEERMVDFFAGLRAIGEGRVRLRIRQVHRVGFAGDQANQAFVGLKDGLVDGFALEAFGGV